MADTSGCCGQAVVDFVGDDQDIRRHVLDVHHGMQILVARKDWPRTREALVLLQQHYDRRGARESYENCFEVIAKHDEEYAQTPHGARDRLRAMRSGAIPVEPDADLSLGTMHALAAQCEADDLRPVCQRVGSGKIGSRARTFNVRKPWHTHNPGEPTDVTTLA